MKTLLNNKLLLLLGFTIVTLSCQKLHTGSDPVCSFEPQYLRITDTLGCRRVDVLSPWQSGEVLSTIYLVSREQAGREDLPNDAPRVTVPIERLATGSATQVGFLHALDAKDCIVAMTTPHLVYNQPTQEVVDLGEDFNMQIEALLMAEPQLLLMTNYGAEMTNVERIRKAGVTVLEVVEWMEQDPLARAAWIRLYGALTGREAQADSITKVVREAYREASNTSGTSKTSSTSKASKASGVSGVSVATGQSYRGTWYVPSGTSYMGRLIHDAGGSYAYENDRTIGSIPLTLEQALTTFSEADIWIGANARSLAELRAIDEKHTWMKAYQSGHVYNFERRVTETGGNDFWETGTVHPEYILEDIRWAIEDGKWKMEDGKCNMEDGKCNMENGRWKMGERHFIKRLE